MTHNKKTSQYIQVTSTTPERKSGATATTVRSPITLTFNYYYSIADGYVYKIGASISGPSYNVDLSGAAGASTGAGACAIQNYTRFK